MPNFNYDVLTVAAEKAIRRFLDDAAAPGLHHDDKKIRLDWAYGVFFGWTVMVLNAIPDSEFDLRARAVVDNAIFFDLLGLGRRD